MRIVESELMKHKGAMLSSMNLSSMTKLSNDIQHAGVVDELKLHQIEFEVQYQAIKLVEEKLLASEIRYRRLFESAKDGILILDANSGQIVDVNPFLIGKLGYSYEELLGK
jgi:PAS domain-containing protein